MNADFMMSRPMAPQSASKPSGQRQKPDLSCAVANGMEKGRRIAAVCCLAAAYFGVDSILHGSLAIMASVSAVLTAAVSAVLLYKNGAAFRAHHFVLLAAVLLCGAGMSLVSSDVTKLVALFSFLILMLSWCYMVCRPSQKGNGNVHAFCDTIFAWFVMPFAGFSGLIAALFCPDRKKKEKNGHPVLWTLVGLLVAIPITVAAAWLLLRGDELFNKIMKVILEDWWRYLKDFMLSVLVAVPFASALYSALDVNLSSYFPREEIAQKTYTGIRVLRCCPHAAALGATVPLCVLYLLFFGVQAGYFLSAFRSYLPDGFTFAEYARRGFFELCIVSVINLAVILLAVFFCRRSENGKGGVLRFITGTLSAMTLALIVIAISKMALYVSSYGLTRLRFYVTVFMLFLAFVFLFLLLYAILPRFCAVRCILVSFFAFLLLFSLADADMLIAKYNVSRYLAGRTEELDLSYFDELSDASVTALLPVAQADGKDPFKENAQARITRFLSQYENAPVLERSLVDTLAYHSAKTNADGFLKSDLKVTVTVQFPSYYEIQSVGLYGESFSEGVQNADGSPITEKQPVFTFSPILTEAEEFYVMVRDSDGYEYRSEPIRLSPENKTEKLYVAPNYDYDIYDSDLRISKTPFSDDEWLE